MLYLSIRKTKGYKSVVKKIKDMDNELRIREYEHIMVVESATIESVVHYNYELKKTVLWLYLDDWKENPKHNVEVSTIFIDLYCQ